MRQDSEIRVSTAVRFIFATATVITFLAALAIRNEPRLYAASGVFGAIWWGWDLLMEHAFHPLGDWLFGVFAGGSADAGSSQNRLTLDDNIRLLENHLKARTSQKVDLNSAIRLEEIYRSVKKDPERARRVIETVLERYPDAPELERFKKEAERDGR
jgi:hypothetical protein